MPAIETEPRATEPLIPRFEVTRVVNGRSERTGADIQDINAMLVAKADQIISNERHKDHERFWQQYLKRHPTPPTWRGRTDIYHYDRVMSGLLRIVRTRTLPRVKYAEFLREHIKSFDDRRIGRRDVAGIWQWFKSLDADSRERFLQIRRDEEAEARYRDRLMDRLRQDYTGFFDKEEEQTETFHGWEWEKTRYDVHTYEGRPRTSWTSRPQICPRTRRTGSNSAQPNRFYSCE